MRRLPTVLTVAFALLFPAAPASAIQSIQRASATVVPSVAGTKERPQAVSLTVRGYFDDISPDLDRQVQFATVHGDIYFPREGLTNNALFPSCAPETVFTDERQCAAGSRVATGTARGVGLGLDEDVTLQVFNRPKGRGDVVLVVGESPLIIREIVIADLTVLTKDPKYRYRLSFDVPRNLQSPAPGVIAAVKDLRVTVPRRYLRKGGKDVRFKKGRYKGQRIPYIATTGCSSGMWTGKYVARYTTSFEGTVESTQTVEVSVPCTGLVTRSARMPGATLTFTVPSGCVTPGGKVSASLTWRRRKSKGNRLVRVRRADFFVGSRRVRTDTRSPFKQQLKIAPDAEAGSTITLRARAYSNVRKGKASTKTITTKVKACL